MEIFMIVASEWWSSRSVHFEAGAWRDRSIFAIPLSTTPVTLILATSNSIGSVRGILSARLLVSPTDNLMPRTHSCAATLSMERFHAYRYRKVFQFHQGVRIHSTRRQIQGRVRARVGGRTRRARQLERAPEDLVRARAGQNGKMSAVDLKTV